MKLPSGPGQAIFLDRDGTLIVDGDYLSDPEKVELLPGAPEALARLRQSGYLLFLLTNQSGVGRGYFSLDDVHRCNARMEELLGLPRPIFDGICIAPEAPDQPVLYRKPSPRYIDETVARLSLDKAKCWMAGDKRSDVESGLLAGINAAQIGGAPISGLPASVRRFPSLFDFALAITSGQTVA